MSTEKESKVLNIFFGTQDIASVLPGVTLAVVVTVAAHYLNQLIKIIMPAGQSPVGTIMIAILLGMIVKNTVGVPKRCNPGISFCLRKLLRLGIILMGIRLSIFAVAKIGALAVGIVVLCIAAALLFTSFIAKRLKLPERLGTLIAVGTGICGASAIVATSPGIEAKEEETAYAVATITIFGVVVMFAYPYLTHLILALTHVQAGVFMGTAIHETAQVTGAGLMYDQLWIKEAVSGPTGADVAIVTKLVRNALMAAVIPLMVYVYTKSQLRMEARKINPLKLFPLFILGFITLAIVRSLGDHLIIRHRLFWDANSWDYFWHLVKHWSGNFLAVAMAGVGLGTGFKKLRELGLKPFFVGLIAAVFVGVISLVLVEIFASFLKGI
jgi:uncharacterized integral membrane protein (TIGR00698 family)